MSLFTEQLHTMAQIDSDQWVNFLILLVLAIFWLFGALIKAAARRKPPQAQPGGLAKEQRETWQQRLARKAQEIQRAVETQRRQAEERVRRMEERATQREHAEQPPPGKLTVRPGKGGESILVYERAEAPVEPRLETLESDVIPVTGDLAGVSLYPPQAIEPGAGGLEAQYEPIAGYDPASIIDYSDPDALKKAILLYEILGKPLGMRDAPEQSTTF